ncbi:MAG TPA: hypothetical protein VFJ02_24870, partial [Vicinamibacterales bacterium]|nr:hypothetical protein [Vicinamibacterales bacterium]
WKTFGAAIAERPAPAWLLGRRAPSLIFYAGQPVASATRDALEHEIGATHEGWIALTREDWSQLSADGGLKGIKEERQEGRKETRVVSQCGRMTLVWFETVPRTETR